MFFLENNFNFWSSRSALIQRGQAVEAIEMALTVFPYLTDANHDQCYIVVLDPVRVKAGFTKVEDVIMIECGVNNPRSKYFEIARSKANVCAKNGSCSHYVQQFQPYMLEKGDTKYQGGVCYEGWVVAVSGFKAVYDELLAWNIVHALIAISEIEMGKILADQNIATL